MTDDWLAKVNCKGMQVYQINKGSTAKCDHALTINKNGAKWCGSGVRMGFKTMGRRRPLSRFMFRVAFLLWMASTVLLSYTLALLRTVVNLFDRGPPKPKEPPERRKGGKGSR